MDATLEPLSHHYLLQRGAVAVQHGNTTTWNLFALLKLFFFSFCFIFLFPYLIFAFVLPSGSAQRFTTAFRVVIA